MTGPIADIIEAAITGEGWATTNSSSRMQPTQAEIAQLAYQRYEARGRTDGHDIDDWVLAERELVHHYGA